jgi:hypothetical protein
MAGRGRAAGEFAKAHVRTLAPICRGWASERMHFPLKAVADAGGWKDVATLVRCYHQTDEQTLPAVMTNAASPTTRRNTVRAVAS